MNDFYNDSDYKQNQFTSHIVFPSVVPGETVRITQDAFLAENPHLTPEDFAYWKKWMLDSLLDLLNHDRREGDKHLPLRDDLVSRHADLVAGDSAELLESSLMIKQAVKTALTAKEAKRLVQHCWHGYGVAEIADMEGIHHSVVSRSIERAKKKLINILEP